MEEVSAAELADLDLDIEDDALEAGLGLTVEAPAAVQPDQAEEEALELVEDDLGLQEDSAPAQTVDAYLDDAFAEPAPAGEPAAAATEADELAFYAAADAAQSPQAKGDAEEEEEEEAEK